MAKKRKVKRAQPAAMKPAITLTRAMTDPDLFGKVFSSPSFWTWRTVAKLIDGIPLTEQREIDLYRECTGRTKLPTEPVRRLIILAGRRAGKDRFESAVSVWRAALSADWRQYQSAGEGAVVILLGADKRQAGILRKYCAYLGALPAFLARRVRLLDNATLRNQLTCSPNALAANEPTGAGCLPSHRLPQPKQLWQCSSP